jgi:cardiolipin synthase
MTPYLILDDKITAALLTAAKSGLDVRIITPHIPDKWYVHAVSRAHYELLTEAGVRIYEYTPGFIHSKVYLVDDCCAVAGTVNLDFRSLYLHFENAVFLFDTACIEEIAADFRETIPLCEEITWRKCRNTGLFQRLIRTALRLFSPLM